MPKLGADMTAGTLVAWLKKQGDVVKRGDIVAEVETEKGNIEVECFPTGVLEKLLVNPGEKVNVGAVLAIIQEDQTATGTTAPVTPAPVSAEPTSVKVPPVTVQIAETGRVRISPAARELAKELFVDVAKVPGSGPSGAISREDVERFASSAKTSPAPATTAADRQAKFRETIAAAMARSKREIPHYYLSTTIDMHPAMTWLTEENSKRSVTERLLYGVLLIKAVALALREVTELNAIWDGGKVALQKDINIGVAIVLRQGGLIAPALHHTDQLSISELMNQMRDLVNRARAGTLRSSELSDPTITVTSLGEQGVESAFGVIYPPQVAIVGFGKVVERPWVVNGQVVARPVITATLSADHRVSDGHRGGRFLAAIERLLQEPAKL